MGSGYHVLIGGWILPIPRLRRDFPAGGEEKAGTSPRGGEEKAGTSPQAGK